MTFESRRYMILAIFTFIAVAFVIRLLYIQVIDVDTWKEEAASISEDKKLTFPPRGQIFDRNGVLLVGNANVYDILVTPNMIKDMDTLAFCSLIGITVDEFLTKMERATTYPNVSYKSSIFEKQVPPNEFAPIAEQLYKYPGFDYQERSLRTYPLRIGGHVLGFIGEVNQEQIDENPKVYNLGDYIGITGMEREYEEQLRGSKGIRHIVKDAFGNEKGSYEDGKFDTMAVSGMDLVTTIDAELQQYGELLMTNKIGSIVAIEPSTGEILSLVSSPNYDPNLLVGRVRGKNYFMLENDTMNPLFNRALNAYYPPGSIFKMVQAMIGLELGVLTPNTGFTCNKSLVGCHNHPTADNVEKAIQFSCNPYFYSAVKRMIQQGKASSIFKDSHIGLDIWQEYVMSFGLGQRLDTDISGVGAGFVPGTAYYDTLYGEYRWAYSTIYSISIGQGEVSVIPLQMANIAAIFANRGYYYTPHFIKSVGSNGYVPPEYLEPHYTMVSPEYFEIAAEAMRKVVEEPGGTARRARIDSIAVCGKTGTAENPHGEDHSVFIAFAPKDDPQIAIAVYVENAGFGGTWAAPIASLMMEKYINGEISDLDKEQRILDANLLNVIPDDP